MISWLKGVGVNNATLIALFFGLLFFAFKCAYLEVSNANLKANHQEQLKNIEQSNKDKLIENQLINDELSVELNTVKQNLVLKQQELERVRHEAIKNDGDTYNGIGTDSLQHYKQALGYRD